MALIPQVNGWSGGDLPSGVRGRGRPRSKVLSAIFCIRSICTTISVPLLFEGRVSLGYVAEGAFKR
jgi:hypothetical protein